MLNRNKTIALAILKGTIPEGAKVYGVAHSLGSVALLRAAAIAPDRFIEIILMQPPGVTSPQSFSELFRRVSRKTIKNTSSTVRDRHLYRLKKSKSNPPRSATTRKLIKSQLSSGYVIAKNPRLALNEALTAISYDITSDISKVKNLKIPVYIIKAPADELFSLLDNPPPNS